MVSPLLQLACPAAEWALRTAVCCAEVGPLAFCSIGLHCEQDQSLLRWVWQGALVPVPVGPCYSPLSASLPLGRVVCCVPSNVHLPC